MTGAPLGWLSLLVKRAVFGLKIKRVCKMNEFVLDKKRLFWWTGRNNSKDYNFSVKTKDKIYCIKILGVRSKRILYGFVDENRYEIKDYTFALVNTMDSFEYVIKSKKPYEFESNSINCIIMLPESVKVTVRDNSSQKRRVEIGNGDPTPEGIFYTAEKFLSVLKEK